MKANLLVLAHAVQAFLFFYPSYAYSTISADTLKAVPRPGEDFDISNGKLLAPILRTRVPGSPGSTAVLNHFAHFFKNDLPQWKVSFQNSTSKTPVTGDKIYPFVNMIVTRDPPWSNPGEVGYLTLVAHYDSLSSPEGFIGAIDSAAPCAMLMHAAQSLDGALTKKWAAMVEVGGHSLEEHKGIQIIFLDGEEAFGVWSDNDSIYGAKSLASEMEATYHPALSTYHNALSSIHLFLLLDLLGTRDSGHIPSYFKTTHWAYQNMATLEKRLREQSLFASSPNHPSKRGIWSDSSADAKNQKARRQEPTWFYDIDKRADRWMGGMIGDDHLPFMARGVDVLHIIPSPFPTVWHKMIDDGKHLDLDTTGDWAVLVTAFAAEWMDLEGYFDVKSNKRTTHELSADEIISKTEL
ncbi:hypothetical protein MMC28_009814 [Mycoblastus sanguinarius]|nr:hypothetical protein [Mycoblastus sanguinarius]